MDKPILFEDYYNITAVAHSENPSLMIPLGVNNQGILEQVEITEKPRQHVLVAGHSGSGKSTCIHSVIASLLLNYSAKDLHLWLSDGGMCEFNRYAKSAPSHIKRVNTSSEPESYIAFIDALEKEIRNRFKFLAAAEKTSMYEYYTEAGHCELPRLVVIMDCFDHVVRSLSEIDHHYLEKIEGIVRRASACGMTFIVTTQDALFLVKYISQTLFDAFGIRIAMKQSPTSYSILFDTSTVELARDLKMGEAIVNVPSSHKMNLLYLIPQIYDAIIK